MAELFAVDAAVEGHGSTVLLGDVRPSLVSLDFGGPTRALPLPRLTSG
jgi:hypothetical protein